MAKKRRTTQRFPSEQEALRAKLFPAVELTPRIRPRLLLVASGGRAQLLLGLLYHPRKQAWQWRLVLPPSATQQGFAHRTRWRQYADVPAMEAHKQARITEFGALARQLGPPAMLRLEFPPQATDEEIVQALWASPLPALFL